MPLLPDDVIPLDNDAVPLLTPDNGTAHQWRIEVLKRGRFWHWRKGRNESRIGRYGGKFELLSDERKAAYNERIRLKNKAKRQAARARAITAK